jgi:hypothetical protein
LAVVAASHTRVSVNSWYCGKHCNLKDMLIQTELNKAK